MRDGLLIVVGWLAAWGVSWPLTFLHELGHAGAVLALTGRRVTIRMGTSERRRAWTLGRLTLDVGTDYGWVGFYRWWGPPVSRLREAAIILAGPAASLVATVGLGAGAFAAREGPVVLQAALSGATAASLLQFAVTLVPMRYPSWWRGYAGLASDGLRAWRLLRDGPAVGVS
jgi:hypothetical protein